MNTALSQAGIADQLLADAAYLVNTEPADVVSLLDHATSVRARLAAAVYRTSLERHRRVDAGRRRQVLTLDAARWGADELARDLAAVAPVPAGTDHARSDVHWATGFTPADRLLRVFGGRTERVSSVAVTVLDGRPIVVGSNFIDATVRRWDLETGEEVGAPLAINAVSVATAMVDGRPTLVTGGLRGDIGRWDPTTGKRVGADIPAYGSSVQALVTTVLNGRPVVVSCGHSPNAVQIFDLIEGTRVGEPLDGHPATVTAAAVAEVDGRSVIVTASFDGTMRMWDAATGAQIGDSVEGCGRALAVDVVDGRPVVVAGTPTSPTGCSLLIRDLTDRTPVGEPLVGHTMMAGAIHTTVSDGRPIAVSAGADGTVRLWDLGLGRGIGGPLVGHTRGVTALALAELHGRPVAVTAGDDHRLMLWDIGVTDRAARLPEDVPQRGTSHRPWRVDWATGSALDERLLMSMPGPSGAALAVGTLGARSIIVTTGPRNALRVLDAATGEPIGGLLTGHTGTVNCVDLAEVDGRTVAVSAADDRTVRIWDLAAGSQIGEPMPHDSDVHVVVTAELDGRPIAVTGSGTGRGDDCVVRIWDLTLGALVGEPAAGHSSAVSVMAVTELDGRLVVLTAGRSYPGRDCAVRIWDVRTGEQAGAPMAGDAGEIVGIRTVELDGAAVAVTIGRDERIRVWDPATREEVRSWQTRGHRPCSVDVARLDGRTVAVTGGDPGRELGGTVHVWDLSTGERVGGALTGHTSTTRAVAVAMAGGRPVAVTGGDDGVRVWRLTEDDREAIHPRPGQGGTLVAVGATELDGIPVAVAGADTGTVRIRDLEDGRPVGPVISTGYLADMALTHWADGRPVAVTSPDNNIAVWDLADGKQLADHPTDHCSEVLAIAVGEERGRQVVVLGTYDNAVSAHALTTGGRVRRRVRSLHGEQVLAAAVTRDDEGLPIAVTVGGSVSAEANVWELKTGRQVCWADVGHTDDVNAVATLVFDGRVTAVTAGRDQAVRLWRVADGTSASAPLYGHTDEVDALACAVIAGRPTVVSGGKDHTVRVWDLTTPHPVGQELVFPGPVTALALTSQGRMIVGFGGDLAVLTLLVRRP